MSAKTFSNERVSPSLLTITGAQARSGLGRRVLEELIRSNQLPVHRMPSGRVLIPVANLDRLREGTLVAA
jgi:hypothetical protein